MCKASLDVGCKKLASTFSSSSVRSTRSRGNVNYTIRYIIRSGYIAVDIGLIFDSFNVLFTDEEVDGFLDAWQAGLKFKRFITHDCNHQSLMYQWFARFHDAHDGSLNGLASVVSNLPLVDFLLPVPFQFYGYVDIQPQLSVDVTPTALYQTITGAGVGCDGDRTDLITVVDVNLDRRYRLRCWRNWR